MPDRPSERNVLIVSSSPLIRAVFHDMFLTARWTPLLAGDGDEATEIFRGWRPSLVLTDFNLSDMTGLELLQDLRHEDQDAVVIILCGGAYERRGKVVGFLDLEAVRAAGLKLGAYAFVLKPVDMDELLRLADKALTARETALRRRLLLPQQWSEVRPLTGVSELLGMFAAVFSVPAPRRASTDSVVSHHR